MTNLPGNGWRDLKRELMSKWHELTEHEIEKTKGEPFSLAELLERKVGMKIEEASEHVQEMAERFHLYDEPKEAKAEPLKEKKERVLELSPKGSPEPEEKPWDKSPH
ncbi:transcriptional regulator [Bdellovibrio svalbardensis]|uniref:Transcriptional regulator n=1 Tax=Bdellovibrio svalbardensis TaxID=2972972 RepID=A0ABT6DGP0_9BACT|nr:transcriptional regulator [Bdellovibrio svalbardensis]MDG0816010.1 transcriptional regulator [Bdellovibrio svalbardensis]